MTKRLLLTISLKTEFRSLVQNLNFDDFYDRPDEKKITEWAVSSLLSLHWQYGSKKNKEKNKENKKKKDKEKKQ